ncbi:hypothetical protein FACS18948_6590 [Clostridia bacterium]|nr:hypothetical protein FACS18948_6590 [Clostridia bacterium]
MPNIKYTAQTPTAAEQQQAQSNIGHVLYEGTTEYAVRFSAVDGFPALTLTQIN